MLPIYSDLLEPSNSSLAESKQAYLCLTERHLQALWLEQKYIHAWLTSRGEVVEVLSPGIWNTEAGPDFLKAHVRIGEKEYRGDVEIHLSDGGWYQHGHQTDERYEQVILHLSYYMPQKPQKLLKTNGPIPFQIYIENVLTVPAARLVKLIDLDLYPYRRFVGSGQCASRLFKHLSEERIRFLLTSAAFWRLERKEVFLQSHLTGRSLQLAGGMAMALGYKHNAEAFLELFLFLFPYRDISYSELLALAIGCCGFFETGRKINWEQSSYYQELRSLWWGLRDKLTHQASLRLDHIRPLNHPVRRLAYLVKLLQDPKMDCLWLDLLREWERNVEELATSMRPKSFLDRLIALIPAYGDDYWKRHYTFEAQAQKKELPLIGYDLKREFVVNTYLPLLYATLKERCQLSHLAVFQTFYASLGAPKTSKGRYLTHRFFGEASKGKLLNKATLMQGAYQLHKDFCVHHEASCEGCPFVERYLNRF
ncbi:hypothetical protein PNK_0464 [Candidatus Protochlamydia naegleriophila]|uniref:DUF2851 family protein n=1 Tax=Candidatus Protochlamydia naegleriophila TaxID=389348 RepID=A0A0U5JAJ0_9BACT|nr:DUF2851 family protein [Candidatus Protochlamydia naegleriophila]CUI16093.1 hypothetical protein PNK_0464 [Candidatus Protochlamydia naegleriophila]